MKQGLIKSLTTLYFTICCLNLHGQVSRVEPKVLRLYFNSCLPAGTYNSTKKHKLLYLACEFSTQLTKALKTEIFRYIYRTKLVVLLPSTKNLPYCCTCIHEAAEVRCLAIFLHCLEIFTFQVQNRRKITINYLRALSQ